jgi:uncharacterized membrane protein
MPDSPRTTDEKLDTILELLEQDRRFNRYMLLFSFTRTLFFIVPLLLLVGGIIYAYFHIDAFIDVIADRIAFKMPTFPDAVQPESILERVREYLP